MAAVQVQSRVAVAVNRLPEEVRRQGVTTRRKSPALMAFIAIRSPHGRYDDVFLSNSMSPACRTRSLRTAGAGGLTTIPAKEHGMRVWLDTPTIKALGLMLTDMNSAIREQNVRVAAGVVGRQPAPGGTDFEFTVTTLGWLSEPGQFAEIVVERGEADAVVRVRDIARVELGARDSTTLPRFNSKPSGIMPVYQLQGANLVGSAHLVKRKQEELKKDFPDGCRGPSSTTPRCSSEPRLRRCRRHSSRRSCWCSWWS